MTDSPQTTLDGFVDDAPNPMSDPNPTVPQASSTAVLIDALDSRYPQWDMWRTATKAWCVRLVRGWTNDIVSGATIEEALQKAVEYTPLPLIPRRPILMNRSDIAVIRNGSKWWEIHHGGGHVCGRIPTKRKAEEYADGFASRSERAAAEWERLYGTIAAGTEGVDFRYPFPGEQ